MAHVVDTPFDTRATSSKEIIESPAVDSREILEPKFQLKQSIADTFDASAAPPSTSPSRSIAVVVGAVLIVALMILGFYFTRSSSIASSTTAKPAETALASAAQPAQLSAEDIKEVKARDAYAARLATSLHQRLPAYKNVKIYADSWLGNKAPAKGPLADIKSRKGDNLMMVFWSPDAGTARGLADFAKSPAAIEAVNAGFAEFQFVDPNTYCYALVLPVTGAGPVTCGIR